MRIVITTHEGNYETDDYRACIDEDKGCWGSGKVPSAAIGSLVASYPERFGITDIVSRQGRVKKEPKP